MQRYSAASSGGGVNNSTAGSASARESSRADSSFPTSNFASNTRRAFQLTPYKLKCDKEPLNCRLGPADFYPQTPHCAEETLTREYLQSGYKETVDGIEEAREFALTQAIFFSKSDIILKCKEGIRKRLRAINESRTHKRKAGQVYGVPLSGPLLIKPGVFPEQRACGEDFRRKWIEALSQYHKRLRSLSEQVPHGYRKKALFEVLIRYNIPFLRAIWFIKVTYLNQVRPASANALSGAPDKPQSTRTDVWTKDVIEYLQQLLDEFFLKDGSFASTPFRDQYSHTPVVSLQYRNNSTSSSLDVEEPPLLFKWWYMVHFLQWNYAEGLLLPSSITEWVLNQLQEKASVEALELLLPVVIDVLEGIAFSQTYVRVFAEIAVRSLNDFFPSSSGLIDNSQKSSLASSLAEMLRYLILAVPDTFVSLDCFPLPPSVVLGTNIRTNSLKVSKTVGFTHLDARDAYLRNLSFGYVVSSLEKRASNFTRIVNPGFQGNGAAKVVQVLDKALLVGDVRIAYSSLFDDLSDATVEERWIAEVSPSLRSSLKWIGSVSSSFICSVFLLCEWATSDYRDCRTSQKLKFTGRKDLSRVYFAVLLMKLRMEDMLCSAQSKNTISNTGNIGSLHDNFIDDKKISDTNNPKMDIFRSPGPLHDIVTCWLDQHEIGKSGGFKCLQVLVVELIRSGVFYPAVYARQLIVSGIMDKNGTLSDVERQRRHHRILKQLPGSCLLDVLEETRVAEVSLLYETLHVYSDERRLLLHGLLSSHSSHSSHLKHQKTKALVSELKVLISNVLHFPPSYSTPRETQTDESRCSFRRSQGSFGKSDLVEGTPGCEDCKKAKQQKLGDERSSSLQVFSSNHSDNDDTWWVRKGMMKPQESIKIDPTLKSTKLASRGRPKTVRKTQSLAHLAAIRIESSQGASTSHICDNKVNCPHHRSGFEGEIPKDIDRRKTTYLDDIGKSLKQLRLLEKRSISVWLLSSIRQLVEANEKALPKTSNSSGAFSVSSDDKNPNLWKLGEDELCTILYILDISSDLVATVKFLFWLLPKVLGGPGTTFQVGRNIVMLPRNRENHVCIVGETFLLSSLQRYENVLVAADLLPDFLGAALRQTDATITPNGKYHGSAAFAYARNVLRKYKDVASVTKWEKNFRATSDQRLIAELDAGLDLGFNSGVPAGVEDFDEYFRQKMSGRMSRTGQNMKEIVLRHVDEAVHYFYGKERKLFSSTALKNPSSEKWEDAYQIAQEIVISLVDWMRKNGSTTQEGDPSLVASAVSAIVGNVGPAMAKLPDFSAVINPLNFSSTVSSLSCARHILRIHVISLTLLKEAFGERMCRMFEIAMASEASLAISGAYAPGKAHRNQFQIPSETHDSNPSNHPSENLMNSAKVLIGRSVKAAAAVSALIIGAIIHGVSTLERMVTVFKLKEGFDLLQFVRSARSRSFGASKPDHCIEVYIHWFRLLIGNSKTVFEGLVAEILSEPYVLALSRMQRMLPLNLVFPPVYSMFAMIIWRPYILNNNVPTREDVQIYQNLSLAVGDVIRHQSFRDLCLRNTRVFYDLLATDVGDSEFAAMLEHHNLDKHLKTMAFVPLRARLFLNSIIDCQMPQFTMVQEDGSLITRPSESRACTENEAKHQDQVVHVLDTLQPAKFHWQWVELRLLLHEHALIEKIETQCMSFVDAFRSLSSNAENNALSENERNLMEILLTRVLVRPDAAPLYSELVHLLGRSLEESLVKDIKWILAGNDVLLGRKSIRQQLLHIAHRRHLSTKTQFWKPWGWSCPVADVAANRGDKRKLETIYIEEGEVVDECIDMKRPGKASIHLLDADGGGTSCQQSLTEKSLAELLLPCIDRSSSELRSVFAAELIKQMSTIDQHISTFARGASKQAGALPSGIEGSSNKSSSRKGMRGGSPGLGRRPTGVIDSVPPSASALKASMWLRLQFLLRLLPIIYADREPSARNMRHMLASITLRLLGTRIVYEDADLSFSPVINFGESLFDTFLYLLYILLSHCKPSCLKPSASKSSVKSPRDFSAFDREATESLQSELDRMELPTTIRRRIQAAMPVLPPLPPTSSSKAVSSLQPSATPGPAAPPRLLPCNRPSVNASGKSKGAHPQDLDVDLDPWTLLEDGNTVGLGGVDHSNLKACSWLKGTVRVRRTELTYIGALDDDS